MLKNGFHRQTIAFLTIALSSIFLYPTIQAGRTATAWLLLGFVVLAALLTLMTK